ncbi:myelin-associated glycoprotein [Alosa pseudoharengus]|uniref:myelin-associated glycoprotein n=1 Tax=Alosa pseudoharengus TaxID=34774 RepID=UPI003F8C5D51
MVVRCFDAGLLLTLFLSVDLSVSWDVCLPHGPLHATPNSSIVLPCSYDFPERGRYKVTSEMWCLGQSHCITQRYIYHSAGIFLEPAYLGRVEYLGSLGSGNCSLRISALRASDSGVYVFRFITDHPLAKLPGQKGIELEITENTQASRGSHVGWILGLLIATTVGAVAVFYCMRRTRQRSHQAVSLNMT